LDEIREEVPLRAWMEDGDPPPISDPDTPFIPSAIKFLTDAISQLHQSGDPGPVRPTLAQILEDNIPDVLLHEAGLDSRSL
jgi:hypothetical protein